LKYFWDPEQPLSPHKQSVNRGHLVDLGPHPADPNSQLFEGQPEEDYRQSPSAQEKTVLGQEIYVYAGRGGYVHVPTLPFGCESDTFLVRFFSTYTFWRFLIQIPLSNSEMKVRYSINYGMEMDFFVPGRGQTMRLAAYSV
jgi:hypothetical protein